MQSVLEAKECMPGLGQSLSALDIPRASIYFGLIWPCARLPLLTGTSRFVMMSASAWAGLQDGFLCVLW